MQFSPDKHPRAAAAAVMAAALAGAAFFAALDAKAAEPSDNEIMTMTAIRWAGMNCGKAGKVISDAEFTASLKFFDALDPKVSAFALRRIKFQTEKAASLEIACKSVIEALFED